MQVLDLEDGHLPIDYLWVGAGTPGQEQFVEDLGGDSAVGIALGVRGMPGAPRRGAASGPMGQMNGNLSGSRPESVATEYIRARIS